MKKFIFYRLRRKLLVDGIKNEIVRDNYVRYLNYNYIYAQYKDFINNKTYGEISSKETKKIWVCWFQGLNNAPDIVKLNFNKLKTTFTDYEVIMITEDNYHEYVNIPKYIIDKFNDKIISYAHFSDILRVYLLCDIGGIWIDSTVLTTAKRMPDYIKSSKFFMFQEISLNRGDLPIVLGSSWFMKSNKDNPILLLTKDLLCLYWQNTNVLIDYFLVHLFISIAARKYHDLWNSMPIYNNINPHIMQFELFNKYDKDRFMYYKSISDFHKLTYKFKKEDIHNESNIAYILGDKYEK